jgi:DinB superfamily
MSTRPNIVLWLVGLFVVLGNCSSTFAQAQNQTPRPVSSRAQETLELWNMIGDKLVAMAKDFPEDKYDFKVQKDQRTFAENLLHAAAFEYVVARKVSGSKNLGPDFGDGDNPPRENFKTKGDVVQFVQGAVAAGAKVIQEQGDAGLDKTEPWGKRMVHHSYLWTFAMEHTGEHYGQLVVYYRANNLVPPDSRR